MTEEDFDGYRRAPTTEIKYNPRVLYPPEAWPLFTEIGGSRCSSEARQAAIDKRNDENYKAMAFLQSIKDFNDLDKKQSNAAASSSTHAALGDPS
jgi:hypothetical protein